MSVIKRKLLWVIGVASLSLMVAPVWAKSLHASVMLDPAVIAGTHLKAGQYDFVVAGNHLTVKDDETGHVVAQANGTLVNSKTKPESDEVVIDNNHIKEVHFANKMEYFKLKG